MNTRPALILLAASALFACLPGSPDPGVGSETHFLTACASDADCGALSCLCGVCTTTCTTTCELGECAPMNHAALASFCPAPVTESLCLAPCTTGADCGGGRCVDGLCGRPLRENGDFCDTPDQCQLGECHFGHCGKACLLGSIPCADDEYCSVPGAASGVCLPGLLEPFPGRLDFGSVAVGTSKTLQLDLFNHADRSQPNVIAQVESRISGVEPTEVTTDLAAGVSIPSASNLRFNVTATPNAVTTRAYRLVIRTEDPRTPPLSIDLDFTGTP
jgi:hypothetical protein